MRKPNELVTTAPDIKVRKVMYDLDESIIPPKEGDYLVSVSKDYTANSVYQVCSIHRVEGKYVNRYALELIRRKDKQILAVVKRQTFGRTLITVTLVGDIVAYPVFWYSSKYKPTL